MIIEGIVHGIGEVEPVMMAIDTETSDMRPGAAWGALGEYPPAWETALGEYPLKRTTRAQRKADKARAIRKKPEPRVSLLCDPPSRMLRTPYGRPFRMPPWRRAPRTHALVNCMACLVVAGRT